MTSQKEINRRQQQFKQKAINEQISPPKQIQSSSLLYSSTSKIKRAKIIEDAPEGNVIFAQLYGPDGVLITEGDPIEVYCKICGGENLNGALPLLKTNDEVDVVQLSVLNDEEPPILEQRWICLDIFHKGGSKECRRAKIAEVPTNNAHIKASLYGEDGILATQGDEFEVTVYCNIFGGTALNSAIPLLEINKDITVELEPYLSDDVLYWRWKCTGTFWNASICQP